ncbi:MAG: hypothetical protein ACRDLQ_05705, partial [Solirubrobacterales bacterium]
VELMRFVLDDAEHGAANGEVLERWLADWVPLAEDAALALQAVFADLPDGIPFDDARVNVRIDVDELFDESGLAQPAAAGANS